MKLRICANEGIHFYLEVIFKIRNKPVKCTLNMSKMISTDAGINKERYPPLTVQAADIQSLSLLYWKLPRK